MTLPRLDELGPEADPARVGTKAASLGLACHLGFRVPDGFVIPASVAAEPATLGPALAALESRTGLALGDPSRPLVLSLRATAPRSLPGQLDTLLAFGATAATVPALAEFLTSRAAALSLVHHVRLGAQRLESAHAPRPRPPPDLEAAVAAGQDVPADLATLASIARRIRDRAGRHLPDPIGVIVQRMVFGNAAAPSGAMVAHSRQPVTGAPGPAGEWTPGQIGEPLMSGRASPFPLSVSDRPRLGDQSLEARAERAFAELPSILSGLERRLRAPVEVELTLERGQLFVLQARPSALGPVAAVVSAVALAEAGTISPEDALRRVDLDTLLRAGDRVLVDEGEGAELGQGLVASPGVASGRLVIRPEEALELARSGPVVLVRSDASPEDAPAVRAASAVATASGGLTSHAAVMSRALGRPCVVSVAGLRVDERGGVVHAGERTVRVGEEVTVDGHGGRLLAGRHPSRWSARAPAATTLIGWAAARAASPEDAPGPWYDAVREGLCGPPRATKE
jgi:pyruvate,orthophosphate dikinase